MRILTKYKPGDMVWMMYHNRPMPVKIDGVHTFTYSNCKGVKYTLDSHLMDRSEVLQKQFDEDMLHPTKADLLSSLR